MPTFKTTITDRSKGNHVENVVVNVDLVHPVDPDDDCLIEQQEILETLYEDPVILTTEKKNKKS